MAATLRLPFSWCAMRSKAGGKMIACARHTHKRAHDSCRLLNGSLGIAASTSTFLQVSRTTCWRRQGQYNSREGRMAVLADARSQHARLRERRYRHAFKEVVQAWLFKLSEREWIEIFFFTRSPGHRVSQWAISKIPPPRNPRSEMQWGNSGECHLDIFTRPPRGPCRACAQLHQRVPCACRHAVQIAHTPARWEIG